MPQDAAPPQARIVTLDVLRGIAIAGMVFLHNGAFHFGRVHEVLDDPPPWLIAFGFLLMWAGLFGIISGAANATTTLRRLGRAAEGDGPWRYPRSLMAGALQTFAIVFVLHWIWTLGTGNSVVTDSADDPELRVSLVLGLIFYGEVCPIHPEIYIFASALWMIAINVLVTSVVFRVVYARRAPRAGDGLADKLLILGAVVLVATPVLRALLFGPMMALLERGTAGIAAAIPLALLINDPNPVFPFVAYGLFGAVLGVVLVRDEPRGSLYRQMGIAGVVLLVLGGVALALSGGVVLAGREEIWGQSALYFTGLSYTLLGLFSLMMIGLLAIFDPGPGRAGWRPRLLRPLMRFGRLSLTIFMVEGILAMALRVLLDRLAPGWNDALWAALAFGAGNVLLWGALLWLWEKADYAGSLEWLLAKLKRTGSRSRALRSS